MGIHRSSAVAAIAAWLIAVSLVATGACTSFGVGDDLHPDAANAASDAGDAGPDASSDSSAGTADAAFSCDAANVLFCADFDTDPFSQGWDGLRLLGGDGGPDTAQFRSPPRSAVFSASGPLTQAASASAYLTKTFVAPRAKVSVAYDLWVDAPGDAYLNFGSIVFNQGPQGFYQLGVGFRAARPTIYEYGDAFDGGAKISMEHSVSMPPKIGAWTHVQLEFSFPGAPGAPASSSLSMSFDGTTVAKDVPLSAHLYFSALELKCGLLDAAGTQAGWLVRVDNLTFDTK